jgi:hypothetical protein
MALTQTEGNDAFKAPPDLKRVPLRVVDFGYLSKSLFPSKTAERGEIYSSTSNM